MSFHLFTINSIDYAVCGATIIKELDFVAPGAIYRSLSFTDYLRSQIGSADRYARVDLLSMERQSVRNCVLFALGRSSLG